MKKSGLAVLAVALVSLLASGTALAQVTDLDRTSVFRDDVVRIGVVVTLCHIPPENPSSARTLQVAQAAVPAHLAHGDTLGACQTCLPQTGCPQPLDCPVILPESCGNLCPGGSAGGGPGNCPTGYVFTYQYPFCFGGCIQSECLPGETQLCEAYSCWFESEDPDDCDLPVVRDPMWCPWWLAFTMFSW